MFFKQRVLRKWNQSASIREKLFLSSYSELAVLFSFFTDIKTFITVYFLW